MKSENVGAIYIIETQRNQKKQKVQLTNQEGYQSKVKHHKMQQ